VSPELNKYYFAKGWLGINLIVSLVVFAVAIFAAPFVTIIFPVTAASWFNLFIIRIFVLAIPVIWFLVSMGFYLAVFLASNEKRLWSTICLLLALVVSGFFSRQLISDLISGSVKLTGQVTDSEIVRIENAYYYHYIRSRVDFRTGDGKEYVFRGMGNHAVRWEEFLQTVEENKTTVNIEVLPNTGFLLGFGLVER
jgi:hypothetical protein